MLQREGVVDVLFGSALALMGVWAWWFGSGLLDMALAVLLTLLEKALCLLSGLDSEPSKLGTLRIVLDLATAGL